MESNKHPKQGGATAEITAKPSRFKRICVFCGSSIGKNPVYHHAAVELGNQLVCLCLPVCNVPTKSLI
ncbi:hypothetical protein HanLR1_Chr14g0511401 [Helianthus annuus]|nr:hypothetical protein HanLR1_Chr14g0511401 [Helianthus annuus]